MGMAYDGEAVMEEGGRVTLTGLPYEAGRTIRYHTESTEEANARSAREIVASLDETARWLKERYPDLPTLGDEAISRESIYEDDAS